jgi:hypothetical protein
VVDGIGDEWIKVVAVQILPMWAHEDRSSSGAFIIETRHAVLRRRFVATRH